MKKYENSANTNMTKRGLSFLDLLAVLFIALKLCGVIDWPWIWVLAPIWGSIVLTLIIMVIVFIAIYIKSKRE